MRQIVVDTETTGLETAQGHRIIEIGGVEVIDRRRTDNRYHQYIRPDRSIDAGALEVHGITQQFLEDKPAFAEIAKDFIDFVRGAELIIHNAPFDVGFIDYELSLLEGDWGRVSDFCTVIDSLAMARERHPGQRNSLDALCTRYDVDNSGRELHGALLDAEILSDVYLAITGGQASLELESVVRDEGGAQQRRVSSDRPPLRVLRATAEELGEHARRLEAIDEVSGGSCVWRRISLADGSELEDREP